MKKVLFIFVGVLGLFLMSCNNEKIENCENHANSYSELCCPKTLHYIDSINQQILLSNSISRSSNRNRDILHADLSGALCGANLGWKIGRLTSGFMPQGLIASVGAGALVVGCYFSATACYSLMQTTTTTIGMDSIYNITRAYSTENILIPNSNIAISIIQDTIIPKIIIPSEYAEVIKVGIAHNAVLDLILNDYDIQNTGVANTSNTFINNLYQNQYFRAGYEDYVYMLNRYLSNQTYDIDSMIENEISNRDVKRILSNYIQAYGASPNDVNSIVALINSYISAIENGRELGEENRYALYSAFSVSLYSGLYWGYLRP